MCILSLDSSTLPSASMTPGKASRAAGWSGEPAAASTTAVQRQSSAGWTFSREPAVSCDSLRSPPSSMLCRPRKSAATSTNCHSPHRRVNQEFPILPCDPGASLRTTVKEEREEEVEEIKTAELFSLALSSVYLTESVNHMTESFALGPAHQVENREGPRCQSSQWVRMRLSRHLVAPAALSSRGSLRTSSSCCSLTDPHRRLSGRTNKIEN